MSTREKETANRETETSNSMKPATKDASAAGRRKSRGKGVKSWVYGIGKVERVGCIEMMVIIDIFRCIQCNGVYSGVSVKKGVIVL